MDLKDNDVANDEKIEKYFNMTLKLLSYMGIHISLNDNQGVVKRNILHQIPAMAVILSEFYCLFCQIYLVATSMNNHQYLYATTVSCDLCTNILIGSKGCMLLYSMAEVNSLLQEVTSVWRQHVPGHKIRGKIVKKAINTSLVCKIFVALVFSGYPVYGGPSILKVAINFMHRNVENYTFDFSEQVFFMLYPFEVNNILTYFLVIVEEEYLLSGVILFWATADVLFAQLTSHACLQFEILCDDINSLMDQKIDDSVFKKNFKILIERHRHLLRICNRIEDVFSLIILITVIVSGLSICFNIFNIMEYIDMDASKEAISHSFLVAVTILEIAFYCIFAEALTEKSSTVGDTIYNSNWTNKDFKLSIYVQMLIVRSQNPFYFTACGFFPIGHARLTKILNAALSYLMMLRTTTSYN